MGQSTLMYTIHGAVSKSIRIPRHGHRARTNMWNMMAISKPMRLGPAESLHAAQARICNRRCLYTYPAQLKEQESHDQLGDRSNVFSGGHTTPSVPGDYPQVLALPISRRPLFPGYLGAAVVKDSRIIGAIREILEHGEPYVGVFLLKDENLDIDMISSIDQVHHFTQGNLNKDFKDAISKLKRYGVTVADVENLQDVPYDANNPNIRAKSAKIVSVFKDIASLNTLFRDQVANFSLSQLSANLYEDPAKLADFAASLSAGEPKELQRVLEAVQIDKRLQKALLVLKKELVHAELQEKISKQVESKITDRQREYYLLEQLKSIKRELGLESDTKDGLLEYFETKAEKLRMPEPVKKVFNEASPKEFGKLACLETAGSEFNVVRNYLDWLTQIPWGRCSRENYNVAVARRILDEDHYGLKDVKDLILEFIAVCRLRGSVQGKIICLVGPPGVGKTSVGKSIARALDRRFYRFSVGGLTDAAEIKGHRRTYVGAMPGKVIQALKRVQTENPLILIDEVDKIGMGYQGDPSAALLEVLDPEQNSSFVDYYMDVSVDLSKVLFVCTANVVDTIPGALRDRMEVIRLSGYVEEEKMAIAESYIVPAAKKAAGLENVHINITKDAIITLIRNYCRESGVRGLKKNIEKIFRKAALKVVQEVGEDIAQKQTVRDGLGSINIQISSEDLKGYVGPVVFQADRLYEETPLGVVMGLAWTNTGGSSLYVESVLESSLSQKSSPNLSKTGHLDDVMQESTDIAYTFAKSFVAARFPKNKFFDKARVHLHCPGGAVPKDGPSAGITMATSLLSLALSQPVNSDIAMTGELTVMGKILQVDGLKEKVIAAKRSKATVVLFPRDNQADWDDIPDHIKQGITGVPVSTYDKVFSTCFGHMKQEDAENAWSQALT
ncbi:ATP-dependent Lon protease pim1 [Apophysomyces sp. BC1015]|nr:ATP-dependent Lon protease pim1 [Apophysomyces sp. BC1015]